jgi:conjugal transfer pilus assembly protein TraE
MNLKVLRFDLRVSRSTIAFQWLLLAGLILLNILLAIGWFVSAGRQHTVIVPPKLDKTVWVENDHASPEYLEQMTYFVSTLILNVQPSTVDYQNKVLLQFVSPSAYGELQAEGVRAAAVVKKENISQWFTPREFSVNGRRLQAAIIGQLQTFSGAGKIADAERKAYVADYEFHGGRMALKSFREVHPDEPFNAARAPDDGRNAASGVQR